MTNRCHTKPHRDLPVGKTNCSILPYSSDSRCQSNRRIKTRREEARLFFFNLSKLVSLSSFHPESEHLRRFLHFFSKGDLRNHITRADTYIYFSADRERERIRFFCQDQRNIYRLRNQGKTTHALLLLGRRELPTASPTEDKYLNFFSCCLSKRWNRLQKRFAASFPQRKEIELDIIIIVTSISS